MTEIIIVRYKMPEIENDCIHSVLDNTSTSYNLTVYDNGPENHNLGQLWNRLIEKSDADNICLLNSDTLVLPEWLSKLEEVVEKEPDVGCVGPTTNNSKNHQSKEELAEMYTVVDYGAAYPDWALSGFCLVFPKSVWKDIGGFPEDLGFYGQEVVLIDKMMLKGYKQYWRKDVFVFHHGSASAKAAQERGEMNELEERRLGRKKYMEFRKKHNLA